MWVRKVMTSGNKGPFVSPNWTLWGLWFMLVLKSCVGQSVGQYGYFSKNKTSYVYLPGVTWDVGERGLQTQLSFRTCDNGELLYQNSSGSGDTLKLSLNNGMLRFDWSIGSNQSNVVLGNDLSNNEWWTLTSYRFLGNLFLNISKSGRVQYSEIISNLTFREYFADIDLSGSSGLYVGRQFTGCLLEGPNVIFLGNPTMQSVGVTWSNMSCPQSYNSCPTENGDINDCYSHPCLNGGTCIDGQNNYTCSCPHLYNGTNCENELSQFGCEVSPCLNGGTCISEQMGDKPYRCQCTEGLKGSNCEDDIDECGTYPCANDVPCIDKIGGYECNCTNSGYNGTLCDTDIDECANDTSVCGVGTCHNNPGSFTCQCPEGFYGTNCLDINECQSNPCQNGGACVNLQDRYECDCVGGYSGDNCERDVDNCLNVTCPGANTECKDLLSNYSCVCQAGYELSVPGPNCTEIDECTSNPCQNSGTCVNLIDDYSCTCAPGYTAKNCQFEIDECAPNPCLNNGSCTDGLASFTCACVLGFEGDRCQTNIQECNLGDVPKCLNGGTCQDLINNYTCVCPDGWEGAACEEDINECEQVPVVCLHDGECRNKNGSFLCYCTHDDQGNYYTGSRCEIKTNHCYISDEAMNDPPACKNGGTCYGLMEGFQCSCAVGFLGERCQEIDECASTPCHYNGTCIDGDLNFTCICIPGTTGHDCSTNIDDCTPNPCGYGQCIDGINEFDCNCTDTGFKGENCSINIDDCESNPCQNAATCNDMIKDYNCTCYDGYEGKSCEIDINECASTPCHFNSPCFQNSNQTLYEIDHPGFSGRNFSYADAAGYLCECVEGSAGDNCSTNIDDCVPDDICNNGTCEDLLAGLICHCTLGYEGTRCETEINECLRYRPCEHESTCTDLIGDYECSCLPLFNGKEYVGKNCSFELTACSGNQCQEGSTCQAYLINETAGTQDYRCLCADGFTGRYCDLPTTMSFNNGSYVSTALSTTSDIALSFRFRTTLTDAMLFAWNGIYSVMTGLFVTVELQDGQILLAYHANSSNVLAKAVIPNRQFNNGDWQKVELHVSNKVITLQVTGTSCGSGNPACSLTVTGNQQMMPDNRGYFGSLQGTVMQTVSKTQFVGCMEDVTIQGTRLYLSMGTEQQNFTGLEGGCPRTQQCFEDTCNQKGDCVDLWNTKRCDCYRPNLGAVCSQSYIAATFQYNSLGEGTATFNLDQSNQLTLQQSFDVSFFIRSRQQNGLVLFFGEYGGTSSDTFVTLELESGHLGVRLKFCDFEKYILSGSDVYANGNQHLVRLHRNQAMFYFYVDGILQHEENVEPGTTCNFNAQNVLFGGKLPSGLPSSGRRRRDTVIDVGDFSSVTSYKGTIQDVQIGDLSLQFYQSDPGLSTLTPIVAAETTALTQGEQTDALCDQLTPCDHNSTCTDQFFNDYSCACQYGYRGKNCSELDFCVTGECPEGSECQSLNDGFECLSTARFDGRSSIASYTNTINTTTITSFSFKFRTYAMNGDILRIGNANRYYSVKLKGEKVIVNYKLDSSEETALSSTVPSSDASWYLANVTEDGSTVTLTLSNEADAIVSNVSEALPVNGDSMDDLVKASGNEVTLGRASYQGCLQEVRIQGILLPFYEDSLFINNTSVEKFLLQQKNFEHGCVTNTFSGCASHACRHGSSCVPDYYTYGCNCTTGYEGRWCQDKVDYCTADSCDHGRCVNLQAGGSNCYCMPGYTGDRCETDILECNDTDICQNNGVCSNLNGSYACDCSATSFIGDNCEIADTVSCDDNPCVNGACNNISASGTYLFNCTCDAGYHGYVCNDTIDYCSALPCLNGGICSSHPNEQTYTCSCPTGYTGDNCESNVDDCVGNSCQNNGECVDGDNAHTCNCSASLYYTGASCTDDINECQRDVPCQHDAACSNVVGAPGFMCACTGAANGFEGIYCENDIDECNSTTDDVCKNGATCTNLYGDYNCTCTDGYMDKNCQTPNCDDVSCLNAGTCLINSTNQWWCQCQQYYEGEYCENKGPCADDPCHAESTDTCTQDLAVIPYTYTCHCLPGWEGQNCTEDINECQVSNGCQNGATCLNTPGSYTCTCATGYTGGTCGTDIDECASNPCQNDGDCDNLIGEFRCNCTGTGFYDERCEEDVDECSLPEAEQPCYNGATCTNTIGSYMCACMDSYEGQNCEVKKEPSVMNDNLTWYIVGPAIALVLILITIGVIWFLICVRNQRATHGVYSPSRQEMTGSRVELGNVIKKPPLERLI